jgi:hypothetical protein
MALGRFAKLLVALTLAVSAGGMVTASTAGASALSVSHSVQSARHEPLSCNASHHRKPGYASFDYCDGSYHAYTCVIGKTGPIGGPHFIDNECETQLWMYKGDSATGPINLCVNPESSTGELGTAYHYFKMSSAEPDCGDHLASPKLERT